MQELTKVTMELYIKKLKGNIPGYKHSDWRHDEYDIGVYEVNATNYDIPYKRSVIGTKRSLECGNQIFVVITEFKNDTIPYYRHTQRYYNIHDYEDVLTIGEKITNEDFLKCTNYIYLGEGVIKPTTVLEALQLYAKG